MRTSRIEQSCKKCFCSFPTISSLEAHYRSQHKDFKPYECLICGHSFNQNNQLRYHIQHSHANSEKTNDESAAPSDVSTEYSIFSCDKCEYTSTNRNFLTHHYKNIHKDNKPTEECLKAYGNRIRKDRNFMAPTPNEDITNRNSDASNASQDELVTSLEDDNDKKAKQLAFEINRDLFCTKCSLDFPTKYSLTRHYNTTHGDNKPHKCKEFEYCTLNSCHLKTHVRRKHLENSDKKFLKKYKETQESDINKTVEMPKTPLIKPKHELVHMQATDIETNEKPQKMKFANVNTHKHIAPLIIVKVEDVPPEVNSTGMSLEALNKIDGPLLRTDIKIKQIVREDSTINPGVSAAEYRAPIIIYYDY